MAASFCGLRRFVVVRDPRAGIYSVAVPSWQLSAEEPEAVGFGGSSKLAAIS